MLYCFPVKLDKGKIVFVDDFSCTVGKEVNVYLFGLRI